MKASEIFAQSNGTVTRAYYAELQKRGPSGAIAVCLFRAQKTSTRAKQYRGRRYRDAAYDVKQWSMGELAKILVEHGEAMGIHWGWKTDPKAHYNSWVMYVELPGIGQVSFHSPSKGVGPEYAGDWDGEHESQPRIIEFCDQVYFGLVWFCACGWSGYAKEMNTNSSGGNVCPRCEKSGGLDTKRVRHPDQMEIGLMVRSEL